MSLPTAIARFLREFEAFDSRFVNAALGSLATDAALPEQAQRRLDLRARLILIKRLAMLRAADNPSLALLDRVIERTAGLQQKYDELMRNRFAHPCGQAGVFQEPLRVWLPTVIEIYDSIAELENLRRMMAAVVDRCRLQQRDPSSSDPGVFNETRGLVTGLA